jgi:hypothetical protein
MSQYEQGKQKFHPLTVKIIISNINKISIAPPPPFETNKLRLPVHIPVHLA